MKSDQDLFNELSYYTLAHSDPGFIHQNAVDAFTAQHADDSSKPIAVVFALVGLYLHLEKGYTGKQVQRAHMQMAKVRKHWAKLPQPEFRGDVTVTDIVAAPPGTARDAMIHTWCESVWKAWEETREPVKAIVKDELGIS